MSCVRPCNVLFAANVTRPAQPCDHVISGQYQHGEGEGHPVPGLQVQDQHEAGAPHHLAHLSSHGGSIRKVHLTLLSGRKLTRNHRKNFHNSNQQV